MRWTAGLEHKQCHLVVYMEAANVQLQATLHSQLYDKLVRTACVHLSPRLMISQIPSRSECPRNPSAQPEVVRRLIYARSAISLNIVEYA